METVNVEKLLFPQHCNERTLMVKLSMFMIFVLRKFYFRLHNLPEGTVLSLIHFACKHKLLVLTGHKNNFPICFHTTTCLTLTGSFISYAILAT